MCRISNVGQNIILKADVFKLMGTLTLGDRNNGCEFAELVVQMLELGEVSLLGWFSRTLLSYYSGNSRVHIRE